MIVLVIEFVEGYLAFDVSGTLVEQPCDDLPDTLFSRVSIDEMEAVIPELGELTHIVEQAAYGS